MEQENEYFKNFGLLIPSGEGRAWPPPAKAHEMKEYEIWIGAYHLGQGSDPSTEPQMTAKVTASDFRIACLLYELRSMLSVIEEMEATGEYQDHQSCRWFYDFDRNRNSWTGQYFETKEEAQKTFNNG